VEFCLQNYHSTHNGAVNHKYQVIVGNIGTVYSGDSKEAAYTHYTEYVDQSKSDYGRAAGEDVTIMCKDEPLEEFVGSLATLAE